MTAIKLPKSTALEKSVRDEALQAGYKAAVAVPLATATACVEALELALESAAGNRNSASDAGVAALDGKCWCPRRCAQRTDQPGIDH